MIKGMLIGTTIFFGILLLFLVIVSFRFFALAKTENKMKGEGKVEQDWLSDFQRYVYVAFVLVIIAILICTYFFIIFFLCL